MEIVLLLLIGIAVASLAVRAFSGKRRCAFCGKRLATKAGGFSSASTCAKCGRVQPWAKDARSSEA